MAKKNESKMNVESYKELFDMVCAIANDADGFGLFEQIRDEDVEKCKWIAAISAILNDVPMIRVEHIFEQRGIDFDLEEFFEEQNI